MDDERKDELGFATKAIHAGNHPERWDMNQIVPPISLSTTYKQSLPGMPKGHDYARGGNPTRDVLQENIAALENAQHCCVFSSGLAATAAMANWLHAGDHILASDDGYGGTQRYFREISVVHHGRQLSFVDLTQLDNLVKELKPNTKMVWFETPSNPLLKVINIAAVCRIVRAQTKECIIVVDNTFMTPFFQRPLELGADVVMHSLTKYMNGHTDVLMGAMVTNNDLLERHLYSQQLAVGSVPSSFDAFLVIRGIKTLHLRMRQHMENALAIAHWLEKDARVEKVLYPELESHPQHKVHKKQASGMSGMISFYLRTDLEGSRKFLANLKLFTLAESLGGYESLAELPAVMTHASVPEEMRSQLGIGDNLIRLSVGCEDKIDLIKDLDLAICAAMNRGVMLSRGAQPSRPLLCTPNSDDDEDDSGGEDELVGPRTVCGQAKMSECDQFEQQSGGGILLTRWLTGRNWFKRYNSDALSHRRVRTGLGWVTAALFIVADIAGGGVVAIPVALLNSGLLIAHLIGKNWVTMCARWPDVYGKVHCRKPYPEMAYRAMGQRAKTFTSTVLNLMNFGISTVYLLLAARILSELVTSLSPNTHQISLCSMMPILALLLLPVTLLKSPQDFWWAVVTAMVTTMLSVLLILFGTFLDKSACAPYANHPAFSSGSFFLSIGIFFFSFGGHSVFPTIQHDMRRPKKFTCSSMLAFAIVVAMYVPISFFGYYVYGDSLHDSIISSIQTTPIQQFANLFIALHCILTLTIVINPLNQEIEHILDIPHQFCWQRIVVRTFVMFSIVFVGLSVPSFGPILNLIGGTTVALTSAILPCLFDLYLHSSDNKKGVNKIGEEQSVISFRRIVETTSFPKLALNIVVIVLAIVCGLAATYSAFVELSTSRFSGPCYLTATSNLAASADAFQTTTFVQSMHCCGAFRNISKHGYGSSQCQSMSTDRF
uniref:cystathionine gamma-lyase n=1 Tax=Globodera rostochiensis TaxID=31243 RepID=A0A914HYS4_GLORO